jgi:S-adenosylmethionine:tRNA ribosyltransferase-isomerase
MKLDVSDYVYVLPQERIALYPLQERDRSRLLVYDHGKISHLSFYDIVDQLPAKASLFFNETKVIPARLHFQKSSGALIEIFLLHPLTPSSLLIEAMQAQGSTEWKCTIGNLKRWTPGTALGSTSDDIQLTAHIIDRVEGIVRFSWTTSHSFAEVLNRFGNTPLPPYLKRPAETGDQERYQTVYSSREGAVAAPTAGLHFTKRILSSLESHDITTDFLTLHVSAGTFQPIKVSDVRDHIMHQEQVVVTRKNIDNLIKAQKVVAVGTTSLRTLESLYWYGVKLHHDPDAKFHIRQNDPDILPHEVSLESAFSAVAAYMTKRKIESLTGETSIYIVPGYRFKVVDALITNFHQPGSTLILLIAAFIGDDWRRVYDEALTTGYRFLSFGDSSLLFRSRI